MTSKPEVEMENGVKVEELGWIRINRCCKNPRLDGLRLEFVDLGEERMGGDTVA
jgi:hypothetical protein